MLRVHSIESFWTHEWPGIRFVLFLQWCIFTCLYCHNPDTIALDWWVNVSIDDIFAKVLKMKPYFADTWGFTVSWGEPLLQAAALLPLCRKLKEAGIHVAVDTNGFVRNEDVEHLLEYVDLVLLDLKHMDAFWHQKITWQSNERVHAFLDHLESISKPTWIRYVYVPNYTDQIEHIHELGRTFWNHTCIERIEILPYHALWVYKRKSLWWEYQLDHVSSPNKDDLLSVESVFSQYFPMVLSR